jgi:hypothetical protein
MVTKYFHGNSAGARFLCLPGRFAAKTDPCKPPPLSPWSTGASQVKPPASCALSSLPCPGSSAGRSCKPTRHVPYPKCGRGKRRTGALARACLAPADNSVSHSPARPLRGPAWVSARLSARPPPLRPVLRRFVQPVVRLVLRTVLRTVSQKALPRPRPPHSRPALRCPQWRRRSTTPGPQGSMAQTRPAPSPSGILPSPCAASLRRPTPPSGSARARRLPRRVPLWDFPPSLPLARTGRPSRPRGGGDGDARHGGFTFWHRAQGGIQRITARRGVPGARLRGSIFACSVPVGALSPGRHGHGPAR